MEADADNVPDIRFKQMMRDRHHTIGVIVRWIASINQRPALMNRWLASINQSKTLINRSSTPNDR